MYLCRVNNNLANEIEIKANQVFPARGNVIRSDIKNCELNSALFNYPLLIILYVHIHITLLFIINHPPKSWLTKLLVDWIYWIPPVCKNVKELKHDHADYMRTLHTYSIVIIMVFHYNDRYHVVSG